MQCGSSSDASLASRPSALGQATSSSSKWIQPSPILFAEVEGAAHAIPAELSALTSSILLNEHNFLSSLDLKTKEAWRDVENLIAQNRRRLVELEQDVPQAISSAISATTFWTAEGVKKYFEFDAEDATAAADDTEANSTADTSSVAASHATGASVASSRAAAPPSLKLGKIKLKSTAAKANTTDVMSAATSSRGDNASRRLSVCSLPSSSAAVGVEEKAAAASSWAAKSSDILQGQIDRLHAAPIRKIFRGLLEKRDTLPAELTLLLNGIEKVQREEAPRIESKMEACPLHVPLHTPFTRVGVFVNRHLTHASEAALLEAAFTGAFKPLLKDLDRDYQMCRSLWNAEDMSSATKADATQTMWRTLLTEVATRRDVQSECSAAFERVSQLESAFQATVPLELQRCAEAVKQDFVALHVDAQAVSTAATGALRHAQETMAAVTAAHRRDRDAIDAALKESWYRVTQSLSAQEKCARKVREAMKELHREQSKHSQHVAEHLHLLTASAQVDESVRQLGALVQGRMGRAEAAQGTSDALHALLDDAEAACSTLLAECERHVGRIRTEETFRKSRVLHIGAENLSQWLRSVNDLSVLYTARHDAVLQKSQSSWQLEYLLSQERHKCAVHLEAVKRELMAVEAQWAKLHGQFDLIGMAMPPVDKLDRGEDAAKIRLVLKSVDDDSVVAKGGTHLSDAQAVAAWSLVPIAKRKCEEDLKAAQAAARSSARAAIALLVERSGKTATPKTAAACTERLPRGAEDSKDGERAGSARTSTTTTLPRLPSKALAAQTPRPPHRGIHQ